MSFAITELLKIRHFSVMISVTDRRLQGEPNLEKKIL
jgi:hypothetical protein